MPPVGIPTLEFGFRSAVLQRRQRREPQVSHEVGSRNAPVPEGIATCGDREISSCLCDRSCQNRASRVGTRGPLSPERQFVSRPECSTTTQSTSTESVEGVSLVVAQSLKLESRLKSTVARLRECPVS